MLESMINGLLLVFQWPAIGYLFLGILIGMWMGAVPGLGGIIGLVLLLPFTYEMEAVPAFALLLGMYAVTSTSDTIASVMLGIPGTSASQATVLDGYPLAKKGQAARAFGAAFTVSAFGGVVGALIMAASLPILLPMILAFGVPEFFFLGVLGLTMVGALAGGSILKGLTVASLGLLLTTIGYAASTGVPRYTFEHDYLLESLPIIPVVLGLFALPELLEMAVRNTSIARIEASDSKDATLMRGVRDVLENWWLTVRCALLGTYIGMLPGLGVSIVDWIAYGHAVQSAKDKSKFGTGDIRGVIAPEAANNATKAGALIPMIAFGIPGSLGTAILLGALVIKGLKPGPEMLIDHIELTFSMVWDIVIANLVAAGLLMIWSKQVAKVSFLPGHLLVPGVAVFVLMGAWLASAAMGDWVSCIAFGFLGYWMKQGGWPRPPLILAIVLGKLMEDNLQLSTQVYEGYSWITGRPIVLFIIALVVLTLILAVKGVIKTNNTPKKEDAVIAGEGSGKNPILSLPLALLFLGIFVWAPISAAGWEPEAQQFPLVVSYTAIIFLALIIFTDFKEVLLKVREASGLGGAISASFEKADFARSTSFIAYLLCILVATVFVGQLISLTAFVAIYLWRWGNYNWKICLGYAAVSWAFIYGFYDQIMHLFFYPSMLFG
ncbi:MAG: tripartite tricarboxylate transporter permease [Rhodospirillaceae bacterium]|nr:tripartite tricarboxylate transporter permease [Rhodospirillaceae bacterium]